MPIKQPILDISQFDNQICSQLYIFLFNIGITKWAYKFEKVPKFTYSQIFFVFRFFLDIFALLHCT